MRVESISPFPLRGRRKFQNKPPPARAMSVAGLTPSFGWQLIRNLTAQLGGSCVPGGGPGTTVLFEMPMTMSSEPHPS